MQQVYTERLTRYVTAMRNGKPDTVPIRPFVAEFTAKYAGLTCQEVTHDYNKAFEAVRKCSSDFDWDAVVGNMVYVWTGLTQAIGLRYYGVPGIHIGADVGFQYREPSEDQAWMRPDEYDALIEDPTSFLFNTWLPRVSSEVVPIGSPSSYRNNLSFLKGGMAMLSYFNAFGPHGERLKSEFGMPGAISGILKAPLDILADKLRGYVGLAMDLLSQPEKVKRACEALAPHLAHIALSGADPERKVPITIWMHRGCVPFISFKHFSEIYWATLRPIIEHLWANGCQTLFYAEGDWTAHLSDFADLPDRSIIFHIDRTNSAEAQRVLGNRFCLSGGLSNGMLAFGSPQEVRDGCKQLIDDLGADGGYILDASAIIQNDAQVENVRAMTDFTRSYGVYPGAGKSFPDLAEMPVQDPAPFPFPTERTRPGICIPWEETMKDSPPPMGDARLIKQVWEENESLAYTYIWHCLVSF